MKILVTGGTGFVGRHIVWRLAERGHDVIFTGRKEAAAAQVIALCKRPVKWVSIEHGRTETRLIESAIGANAVIHTAALSSPWGKYNDFISANVTSTQEVLAACREHNIPRLVHISTPSLYFDFSDRLNISEQEPLPPPVNNYAHTKALAEQLILHSEICERVILRPRAIFGPWDNTLMPRILRLMQTGSIPLIRGGHALLDITYVENLVDAVELSITQQLRSSVKTYNVTNGDPQPLLSLLTQMCETFSLSMKTRKLPWWVVSEIAKTLEFIARTTDGREPKITRYGAGVLAFSQTLDISAIRRDLGYQPKISIAEGMRRHAAWLTDISAKGADL